MEHLSKSRGILRTGPLPCTRELTKMVPKIEQTQCNIWGCFDAVAGAQCLAISVFRADDLKITGVRDPQWTGCQTLLLTGIWSSGPEANLLYRSSQPPGFCLAACLWTPPQSCPRDGQTEHSHQILLTSKDDKLDNGVFWFFKKYVKIFVLETDAYKSYFSQELSKNDILVI